jgi:hypothetical protein
MLNGGEIKQEYHTAQQNKTPLSTTAYCTLLSTLGVEGVAYDSIDN